MNFSRDQSAGLLIILAIFAWPLLTGSARENGSRLLDEGLLIACCRALLLITATAAARRDRALVAGVSLFLIVAATTRIEARQLIPIVAAYATVGCSWLASIQARPSVGMICRSRRWILMTAALAIAACCLFVTLPLWDRTATALCGWFASSGGTERASDDATSGVGDGPDQVAGSTNARSAGFDQSDVFMNSQCAGLYDAFIEAYGEPSRKGEMTKLQMLRQDELSKAKSTGSEDYRVGREFSLQRLPLPARRNSKPESHESQALIVVDGPLPQHIRTAAYDTFDGTKWTESSDGSPGWKLAPTEAPPWFKPEAEASNNPYGSAPFSGAHVVKVRVGGLQSRTLPLPAGFDRLHIGRVTRLPLFGFKHPDLLEMVNGTVPVGTVIESVCGNFDPEKLTIWSWAPGKATASNTYASEKPVRRLARIWTQGVAYGWPQIMAIVEHLQNEYELTDARQAPWPIKPIR